jgi:probable HAF family extracellular repeat protein
MNARLFAVNPAAVLALIAVGSAARAGAQKYTLAAIPNAAGLSGTCNPYAVNDRGQTVGSFAVFGGELPFLYDPSAGTRILPGFAVNGGADGKALSINHAGEVVGVMEFLGGIYNIGFIWDSVNGTRQIDQIGDSNGVTAASLGWSIDFAWQVNSEGDILVHSPANSIGIWRMATFGSVSVLSVIPVPYDGFNTGIVGFSTRLNDFGIVLTYQPPYSTNRQPVLWDSNSGAFTDISPTFGLGVGLNNNGQAVGNGANYDTFGDWFPTGLAWLYSGSAALTYVGSLGGGTSNPSGINDLNQVVGNSRLTTFGSDRAFIWQNGTMQDLNVVINPGRKWVLTSATAISNPANAKRTAGYIVGAGTLSGVNVGWIATPK